MDRSIMLPPVTSVVWDQFRQDGVLELAIPPPPFQGALELKSACPSPKMRATAPKREEGNIDTSNQSTTP